MIMKGLVFFLLFVAATYAQMVLYQLGTPDQISGALVANGTSATFQVSNTGVDEYNFYPVSGVWNSLPLQTSLGDGDSYIFGTLLTSFTILSTSSCSVLAVTSNSSFSNQILSSQNPSLKGMCPDPSGTSAWFLVTNTSALSLVQVKVAGDGSITTGISVTIAQSGINPLLVCGSALVFVIYGSDASTTLRQTVLLSNQALVGGGTYSVAPTDLIQGVYTGSALFFSTNYGYVQMSTSSNTVSTNNLVGGSASGISVNTRYSTVYFANSSSIYSLNYNGCGTSCSATPMSIYGLNNPQITGIYGDSSSQNIPILYVAAGTNLFLVDPLYTASYAITAPNITAGAKASISLIGYDSLGYPRVLFEYLTVTVKSDSKSASTSELTWNPSNYQYTGSTTSTLTTAGQYFISVKVSPSQVVSGNVSSLYVLPSSATATNSYITTYPPASGFMNTQYSFSYVARDQYLNLVTNGAAKQFNISYPSYCQGSNTDYYNGSVSVNFVCLSPATPANVSISINTGGRLVGSSFNLLLQGNPVAVLVSQAPTMIVGPNAFLVTVLDNFNNTIPQTVLTPSTTTDLTLSFQPSTPFTITSLSNGTVLVSFNQTLVGSYSFIIQRVNNQGTNTTSYSLIPGPVSYVSATKVATNLVAGTNAAVSISAYDVYSNLVPESVISGLTSTDLSFQITPPIPSSSLTANSGSLQLSYTPNVAGSYSLVVVNSATSAQLLSASFNVSFDYTSQVINLLSPQILLYFAGSNYTMLFQGVDQYGNTIPGSYYTYLFNAASITSSEKILSNNTFAVTFSGSQTGNFVLNVSSTITGEVLKTYQLNFQPASTSNINILSATYPSAGSYGIVVLQGTDKYGNVIPANQFNVSLTGQFNYTMTDYANNSFAVSFVTTTSGSFALSVISLTSNSTVAAYPLTIPPASAAMATISPMASSMIAGSTGFAYITTYDAYSNLVPQSVTSTNTSSDLLIAFQPQPSSLNITSNGGGQLVLFYKVTTAQNESLSVSLLSNDMTVASEWFIVTPDVASSTVSLLNLPHPSAGSYSTYLLSAQDKYGNIVPAQQLSPSFSASFTFSTTAYPNNTLAVSFMNTQVGLFSMAVLAPSLNNTSLASFPILVQPGPAQKVNVSSLAASWTAGSSASLSIDVYDAYSNYIAQSLNGSTSSTNLKVMFTPSVDFTLSIINGGTLQVNFEVTASQTYNVTVELKSNLMPVFTQLFTVIPDYSNVTIDTLKMETPSAGSYGAIFLQGTDEYGNVLSFKKFQISFSDPSITYSIVNYQDGSFAVNYTTTKTGNYVMYVVNAVTSATLASYPITIGPGPVKTASLITQSFTWTAGQNASIVAKVFDAYGNIVPQTSISAKDLNGISISLPSVISSYTTAVLPDGSFEVIFTATVAGTYTFSISASGTTLVSQNFVIAPGAFSYEVISPWPLHLTAGATSIFYVMIFDGYGNAISARTEELTVSFVPSLVFNEAYTSNGSLLITLQAGSAGSYQMLIQLQQGSLVLAEVQLTITQATIGTTISSTITTTGSMTTGSAITNSNAPSSTVIGLIVMGCVLFLLIIIIIVFLLRRGNRLKIEEIQMVPYVPPSTPATQVIIVQTNQPIPENQLALEYLPSYNPELETVEYIPPTAPSAPGPSAPGPSAPGRDVEDIE